MLKILLLTGDAGEAQEIYYAKYRLEEEGWEVRIATTQKKTFLSVVHDFEPGFDTYTEKPGYRVEADFALEEVRPDLYQGLVLPGGRAPEYLRNRPAAVDWYAIFWRPTSQSPPTAMALYWFWPPDWQRDGRSPATLTSSPIFGLRVANSSIAMWLSTATS